jgi:hypothetical protein
MADMQQPPPLPPLSPPPLPPPARPSPRELQPQPDKRFRLIVLALLSVVAACSVAALAIYLHDRSEAEAVRQRKLDTVQSAHDYLIYAENEERGAFFAHSDLLIERLKRLQPGDKDLPPLTEKENRIEEVYRIAKETAEGARESYEKACRIARVEP